MISHAAAWALCIGVFLIGFSLGAITLAFFVNADCDDDDDADTGPDADEYEDWRHG